MPRVEVTRTYLQMTAADQLQAPPPSSRFRIETVLRCPPAFYRFLYREVGARYHWVDRAGWTDDEIRGHLATPGLRLHVLYEDGAPAGYYELQDHPDGSTEIAYFGLLPEYHGLGLGKGLLADATRRAWSEGAGRVWLHTCTLDGAAALPNYRARGFQPFKEERYWTEVP
jgi:GNAT superfamily N-acetyltransferase